MRNVKDGHGLQGRGVWLGVTREVNERNVGRWQVPQNLVAAANAAAFAK